MSNSHVELEVLIKGANENSRRPRPNENVIFCLSIPNRLLHSWYVMLEKSFISAVNSSMRHGKAISLKEDQASRLEKRLRAKATTLNSKLKTCSKRDREKIIEKVTLFDVMDDEVLSRDDKVLQ